MQAAAGSAYQRIVSAREAATSGGSSSSVNQARNLPTQRDPQGDQASPADAASRPGPSAEGHHDLAQLLSAAGDAQAALEEFQQHANMLEASSAALRIAEDFTMAIRYCLSQLDTAIESQPTKDFAEGGHCMLGKASPATVPLVILVQAEFEV